MARRLLPVVAIAALILCQQAMAADTGLTCGPRVLVSYKDSSPDYFIIENLSAHGWELAKITVDLRGSTGNVIFDTDEDGPGVNTASSFFAGPNGRVKLSGVTPVKDGDRELSLSFQGFVANEKFSFFIDLDTQIPDAAFGQAFVADNEMAGSRIVAAFLGSSGQTVILSATFNTKSIADTGARGCV